MTTEEKTKIEERIVDVFIVKIQCRLACIIHRFVFGARSQRQQRHYHHGYISNCSKLILQI